MATFHKLGKSPRQAQSHRCEEVCFTPRTHLPSPCNPTLEFIILQAVTHSSTTWLISSLGLMFKTKLDTVPNWKVVVSVR